MTSPSLALYVPQEMPPHDPLKGGVVGTVANTVAVHLPTEALRKQTGLLAPAPSAAAGVAGIKKATGYGLIASQLDRAGQSSSGGEAGGHLVTAGAIALTTVDPLRDKVTQGIQKIPFTKEAFTTLASHLAAVAGPNAGAYIDAAKSIVGGLVKAGGRANAGDWASAGGEFTVAVVEGVVVVGITLAQGAACVAQPELCPTTLKVGSKVMLIAQELSAEGAAQAYNALFGTNVNGSTMAGLAKYAIDRVGQSQATVLSPAEQMQASFREVAQKYPLGGGKLSAEDIAVATRATILQGEANRAAMNAALGLKKASVTTDSCVGGTVQVGNQCVVPMSLKPSLEVALPF